MHSHTQIFIRNISVFRWEYMSCHSQINSFVSDIPISFDEDVAVEKTKTDSSLLYALGESSEPSEPILDPSCGLLVEKMPPGVTLKSLWAL